MSHLPVDIKLSPLRSDLPLPSIDDDRPHSHPHDRLNHITSQSDSQSSHSAFTHVPNRSSPPITAPVLPQPDPVVNPLNRNINHDNQQLYYRDLDMNSLNDPHRRNDEYVSNDINLNRTQGLMYMRPYNSTQQLNQTVNQPNSAYTNQPNPVYNNHPNSAYPQQTYNHAPYNQPINHQYSSISNLNLPNLPNMPTYGNYSSLQQIQQPMPQTNYISVQQPLPMYKPPLTETNKRKADSSSSATSQKKSTKKAKTSKNKLDIPPCVSLVQFQRRMGPKPSDLLESRVTAAFADMHAANYDILSNVDECWGSVDVKMIEERVIATVDERDGTIFDEYKIVEVALKKDEGNEKKMHKLLSKVQKRARRQIQDDAKGIVPAPLDENELPEHLYVVGEQQRRSSGSRSRSLHSVKWPAVYMDLKAANMQTLTSATDCDGTIDLCHVDNVGCVRIQVDKGEGVHVDYTVTQVPFDNIVIAESECTKLLRRLKSKGRADPTNPAYVYDSEEEFNSDDDFSDDFDDED